MGTLRFFLALSVVFFHLTHPLTTTLGSFAVNFFYVISGFLITLVLNETYQFRFASFAANRFLRLLPAYYVCAAIALTLHLSTTNPVQYHGSWGLQLRPGDLWGNLLIFPWALLGDNAAQVNFTGLTIFSSDLSRYRLVPSTWSVGVEFACYALLWLFVARNAGLALLGAGLSIVWHILNENHRYVPVPAALLPFSLGALAYFWGGKIGALRVMRERPTFPAAWLASTIAVFLINWALSEWVGRAWPLFYYGNTVIAFLSILAIQSRRIPGPAGRWDRWLGDLSYPVFLAQWFCGYAAWLILGGPGQPIRSFASFVLGAILSIALAALIVRYVDRPIAALRTQVRGADSGSQLAETGRQVTQTA